MKYKLVFFDVDGTLFSHKSKSIPNSTIEAINKLKQNGIKICIASGRSPLLASFTNLFKYIDYDYFIGTNGTLVIDKNNNIIHSSPLNKKGIELIINKTQKHNFNIAYMTLDNYFLQNNNTSLASKGYDPLSIPLPNIKPYNNEDIYQINLFCDEKDICQLYECTQYLQFSKLANYGYDVYTLNCNKATGIQALLKHLNIDKNEIIAFGDGHNDEEMISYAGLGIAMGNSIEKIKKAADYITTDIDDNGIFNALKHFKII